jgi:membrane fusion protein (multidrug efflux system)
LPSEDIYRIEEGRIVNIRNDLTGIISSIDPAADPITRKVKVEITFDNKDKELIPGTFVEIEIPLSSLEKTHPESVFIPLRAVTIAQNESYVFVNSGGKARKINVVTGKTEGVLIEILDGLHDGDELIVEGAKNLENGEQIEINN